MGGTISYEELKNIGSEQYKPKVKYEPFPAEKKVPPGLLVSFFKANPPGYNIPVDLENDPELFWWVDCHFRPYRDNELVISAGVYRQRPSLTPLKVSPLIQGLIYCVKYRHNAKLKCSVIKGTRSSAPPAVYFHPNTIDISYCGTGDLVLLDMNTLHQRKRNKSMNDFAFRYSCVSPNGLIIALVSRLSWDYKLTLFEDNYFLSVINSIDLKRICPGFRSMNKFIDEVECEFSPDSKFIAISSSFGKICILEVPSLKMHCSIVSGIYDINDTKLCNARCSSFDPRYKHKLLAFGCTNTDIHICDIESIGVRKRFNVDEFASIETIKYGVRGEILAVALSNAKIHMYNPDTEERLYTLDAASLAGDGCMVQNQFGEYPEFVRMSFSQSGDMMSSTTTDGVICLWQLYPVCLSLHHLARRAILQNVKVSDVYKLPLPPRVLLDILEWPCS